MRAPIWGCVGEASKPASASAESRPPHVLLQCRCIHGRRMELKERQCAARRVRHSRVSSPHANASVTSAICQEAWSQCKQNLALGFVRILALHRGDKYHCATPLTSHQSGHQSFALAALELWKRLDCTV